MRVQSFFELYSHYDWDLVQASIADKTATDVRRALSRSGRRDLEDFKALISPAAEPYLEEMAQRSRELTLKRFGKTIQLYMPLYLSNECSNGCVYCGFAVGNALERKTLDRNAILAEVEALRSMNCESLLLVTGESRKKIGIDYIEAALQTVRPHFAQVSAEVQPLEQGEYERLIDSGLKGVYVYQETYHRDMYRSCHPVGRKSNFQYRLETPDRLGRAGVRNIGLGILIGLEDWRADSFFTALHLQYLERNYWRSNYCVSFPRLRPHAGGFEPTIVMRDRELVQLICAYRIFDEELELSLSTRETPDFRDNVVPLGVTSLSAGSKTNPGGYAAPFDSLKQFEISDDRSPAQIAAMLREKGLEPVWKNWDVGYECCT